MDHYNASCGALIHTQTMVPPINFRNNAMGIGMTWATASEVTRVYADGFTPDEVSYAVDSRSLLAVEDITVQSVAYTNCLKLLTNRSGPALGGHYQEVDWICPLDGLVKTIKIEDNGSVSRTMEFDPTQSTPAP
jgi:hypothetical protein